MDEEWIKKGIVNCEKPIIRFTHNWRYIKVVFREMRKALGLVFSKTLGRAEFKQPKIEINI